MRAKTYGAETARAKLPELLERAHHGMRTIITKRGKAYAVLAPADGPAVVRKGTPSLSLKGSGAGLWGADPAATVAGLRDEWG
jgi:prevent-host-death family protein